MLEQRIGQRRDATRALPQVPTGWGTVIALLPHQSHCRPQRGKSQGYGDSVPIFKKDALPTLKKKLLTNGGESWSAADALVGLGPLAPP